MIYAIDNQTKEHSIIQLTPPGPLQYYRIVQADADGWIEWSGGERPLPDDQLCEVKLGRSQQIAKEGARPASYWSWAWLRRGDGGDIIAYRPILDDTPQAPEWDGEGLPPVGVRAEFSINDGKYRPAVVKYKSSKFCILQYDLGSKGERCYTSDHHIDARPIRTDREKWIEAAIEAHANASYPSSEFEAIYDALKSGDLRQP